MESPHGHVVRFLALGDSYTIGEAVDPADRWPSQLAAQLRQNGIELADPAIVARTGWTTGELNAGIEDADPPGVFDFVTLLVGVNNQYRGRSVEEYAVEFRRLLERAIGFAGARPSRVIVVSIPDWGVTPFARQSGRDLRRIADEVDAFNAVGREEAGRAGVRFVDVTAVSRQAAADPNLTAGDGLHPSRAMYKEWTAVILPAALEALRSSVGP